MQAAASFPCCDYRRDCYDPILHLALHCPSDCNEMDYFRDVTLNGLDTALMRASGRKYPWRTSEPIPSRKKRRGSAFLVGRWVEETPMLYAMAQQETLFIAPDRWPREVEKSFGRYPMPTPFEVANATFSLLCIPAVFRSHEVVAFRAYSFGLPLDYIASCLHLNEPSVLGLILRALKLLLKEKRFILWCMHIDLTRVRKISAAHHGLNTGILDKLRYTRKLFDAPERHPEELFSFLTDSPLMLNLCRSGLITKKSLRVDPPFRVGHRVLQDDYEAETSKNGSTSHTAE